MAMEVKKENFDADKAGFLVKELRLLFDSGKTKSYEWRVAQLKGISRMVQEREEEIVHALYSDLSKPEHEAVVAEICMVKSSCKLALQKLRNWMAPTKVKTPITTFPSSAEIVSEPLGVVLVISAWNYPFLLAIDPIIGAVSAGNAVVLKPSEIAPATSSLLAKLLHEYLDSSCIKVIEGAVPETSALLEQHWDKIFYTGNSRVARIVMAAAARHLTPVTLELGGKCPVVVDSNVNLKVAARRIIAGKWACNNGQTCVAVDYLITTKDFAPKLLEALTSELDKFFGKNPMGSGDISRIVNPHQFTRLIDLLNEDGVSDKIILGGQSDKKQLRIAPTILLDVPKDCLLMKEEIFGPLLPIVTVQNVRDSFALIKSKPKPLAAYLFTNNDQLKKDFINNISAGGMLINDTILHLTVHGLPFGGVGESGMGSYHGKFSFDEFSHKKGVLSKIFDVDVSIRYPPYTPKKLNVLKALLNKNLFHVLPAMVGPSRDKK